ADEGLGRRREARHARLVAQDAAARERARGVDGEHGDLLPEADQVEPEGLDEGALPYPRHAAHADAGGAARAGEQELQEPLRRASSWTSCGTSVLWPPDWVEMPTTCTSFSTAWRATSSGVWKSMPTSTSKPRSAKAVAITLAPRSWPSWPILATSMRGRRPCSPAKRSTS